MTSYPKRPDGGVAGPVEVPTSREVERAAEGGMALPDPESLPPRMIPPAPLTNPYHRA